ncbi:MAG TPA: endonuclease/exonuclease/phosphatase family protein [Patescibacteria group bacterium]|nr:endonuclease/exonuclease/phosphatase family protein [Patescibacteria group bacterium]
METRFAAALLWLKNPVTFFTPLLAVALAFGLAPCEGVLCDLASHFMAQYALAALGLFVLTLAFRLSRRWLAVNALLFLLAAWQLLPFMPVQTPAATSGTLKILQANTYLYNPDPEPLRRLIAAEKPDIVVTTETTPAFSQMMEGLKAEYPHQLIWPQKRNPRGLGVISKLPFQKITFLSFDSPRVPAQEFSLRVGKARVTFMSIHPLTPTEDILRRDRELEMIAQHYQKRRPDHLVVLGDFNATPYCRAYRKLTAELNLRNAREGFGLYPSWPTFFPTPLPRIAIDHVLVSRAVKVHDFRTGPEIGSDHLPTITEISVEDAP